MIAQVVNVAIVLIGIYIALAVACSWVQEQIAAILKLRGSTLALGVRELISGDADLLEKLGRHPMIASASSEVKVQFPSYIEARNFTLAFWQSVGPKADALAGSPLGKAILNPKDALEKLIVAVNEWAPTDETTIKLQTSAIALLNAAEGDYDKLLQATDAWFDAQMDRVSGWYRRKAQYFLIGVAFLIAFGGGIDTLDIGRQLFAAPELAAQASESLSAIDALSAKDPSAANAAKGAAEVTKVIVDSKELESLRVLRPNWWHWWSPDKPRAGAVPDPDLPELLLGMLITVVAISLGAPFWFDVLKGIVNVRMAGEKPAGQAQTAS